MTRITEFLSQPEPWAQRMARNLYRRRLCAARHAGLMRLRARNPREFAKAYAAAHAERRAADPGTADSPAYLAFVRRRGTALRRLEAEGLRLLRAERAVRGATA